MPSNMRNPRCPSFSFTTLRRRVTNPPSLTKAAGIADSVVGNRSVASILSLNSDHLSVGPEWMGGASFASLSCWARAAPNNVWKRVRGEALHGASFRLFVLELNSISDSKDAMSLGVCLSFVYHTYKVHYAAFWRVTRAAKLFVSSSHLVHYGL